MRDLSQVVDAIRTVRQARRRFLQLWRLEGLPAWLASAPAALDRLAADIESAGNGLGESGEATATKECISLKTRTTQLFRHGRMADEWE